ncbi:hypothetical protein MKX42_30655 [Paenibacillus sp. FSL R7-0204]|uniref:hypothetical protein n=1 Tax=Paenibacillus sp. FSL R7-0204 TaxID=2921675 RepID=UPI0030FA2083
MPISRYGGVTGNRKISEDFENINVAFNNVAAESDTNKATMDGHIGNGNLHTTAAEKTKLSGIATAAGTANSATDSVIGNRTATDNVTPSLTGTITALFSSLFTLIKGITGKSSALTAPAITLEATRTHVDNGNLHTTAAEKTKLSEIEAKAEVNQNAFAVINTLIASAKSDTVTFEGGTGITISVNTATKKVTWTATGTATPGAHASSHLPGGSDPIALATSSAAGLMAAADKVDLTNVKTKVTALEDFLGYMPIDGGTFDGTTSGPGIDGGTY